MEVRIRKRSREDVSLRFIAGLISSCSPRSSRALKRPSRMTGAARERGRAGKVYMSERRRCRRHLLMLSDGLGRSGWEAGDWQELTNIRVSSAAGSMAELSSPLRDWGAKLFWLSNWNKSHTHTRKTSRKLQLADSTHISSSVNYVRRGPSLRDGTIIVVGDGRGEEGKDGWEYWEWDR